MLSRPSIPLPLAAAVPALRRTAESQEGLSGLATGCESAKTCEDEQVGEVANRGASMPAAVWVALAPLLAGRPVIRQSRDRGRSYPHRWQRPLEEYSDSYPTAVPVYSAAGDTRVLVVDLDSSKHGPRQVAQDSEIIRQLVTRAGGSLIADESPNGGRHLYIPMAEPVDFHAARDVAEAVALRAPSMDTKPNQNLKAGLIRPPGARHRSGGFQTLHGSLEVAVQLARTGNPRSVWQNLRRELSVELAIVAAARTAACPAPKFEKAAAASTATSPAIVRRGGARELAGDYLQIARTGDYDQSRYPTPSQARQAVLTAAAWAGMTLVDVLARIHDGRWAGLSSFYARYRTEKARREALTKFDWPTAVASVTAERAKSHTPRTVPRSPTSKLDTHRGSPSRAEPNRNTQAEFQFLRTWHSALLAAEQSDSVLTGQRTTTRRFVLRAMGEAAMKSGSRYVHYGVRSLSIATGVDHTTVATHLRVLRDDPDGLINLIEDHRGTDGDLYELVIPDRYGDRADRRPWRRGKFHALRPAFFELGAEAALVYETLEHAVDPLASVDLIKATQLGRTTVHHALRTLASYNLAEQHRGRWIIQTGTSLTALAEQLGVLDTIRIIVQRHRDERARYRYVLLKVEKRGVFQPPTEDWDLWPPEPPPDDDGLTLLDLLQRVLGATPIPA